MLLKTQRNRKMCSILEHQSIETDPEMANIMELAEQGFIIPIMNALNNF